MRKPSVGPASRSGRLIIRKNTATPGHPADRRPGPRCQIRRTTASTLAALLSLALGIGATTTIFSVVTTLLLGPLPFPDSDRLVRLIEHFPSTAPGRPVTHRGITYQEFLDWQKPASTLSGSIAVTGMGQQLVRTTRWSAPSPISSERRRHTDVRRGARGGSRTRPDVLYQRPS
jgi:hypothetical protein